MTNVETTSQLADLKRALDHAAIVATTDVCDNAAMGAASSTIANNLLISQKR